MGSSTFSYADKLASRLNVWNTNPGRDPPVSEQPGGHGRDSECVRPPRKSAAWRGTLTDAAEAQVGQVRVRCILVDGLAQDLEAAARGAVNCPEDVEQRRLATARRTAQHHKLAAAARGQRRSVLALGDVRAGGGAPMPEGLRALG